MQNKAVDIANKATQEKYKAEARAGLALLQKETKQIGVYYILRQGISSAQRKRRPDIQRTKNDVPNHGGS